MIWHDLLMVLIGFAGGGAAALINNMFTRGTQKADAAKALTEATIGFTEAVTSLNTSMRDEVVSLKRAIMTLTDAVDAIIPHIQGLSVEQKRVLIEANNMAKLTL